MQKITSQSGMTAIVTIIIISAASLIAVRGVARMGLSELDMSYTRGQGEAVLQIAQACAEDTLRQWQLDPNYSASEKTITFGSGECTLNTSSAGNNRTAIIEANIDKYYKKIEINLSLQNEILELSSWKYYN